MAVRITEVLSGFGTVPGPVLAPAVGASVILLAAVVVSAIRELPGSQPLQMFFSASGKAFGHSQSVKTVMVIPEPPKVNWVAVGSECGQMLNSAWHQGGNQEAFWTF